MSKLSERSQEITNAFQKYVKGGKKSLIESFSIQEIERALVEYALDKEFPFYIAMERIEQLKEIENRRLQEVRDSEDKKKESSPEGSGSFSGFCFRHCFRHPASVD